MPLASGAGRTVLPNTGAFPKRQRTFRKRPQPLYRLQEPSLDLLRRLGFLSCICAIYRIYMLTHSETIFNAFVLGRGHELNFLTIVGACNSRALNSWPWALAKPDVGQRATLELAERNRSTPRA